jgi:hypothetical protein
MTTFLYSNHLIQSKRNQAHLIQYFYFLNILIKCFICLIDSAKKKVQSEIIKIEDDKEKTSRKKTKKVNRLENDNEEDNTSHTEEHEPKKKTLLKMKTKENELASNTPKEKKTIGVSKNNYINPKQSDFLDDLSEIETDDVESYLPKNRSIF